MALSLVLLCGTGGSYLIKYYRVSSGITQLHTAMTQRQVLEILGRPDAQINSSEITSASEGWLMFVGTPEVASTHELVYTFPFTAEEWHLRFGRSGELIAKSYLSSP